MRRAFPIALFTATTVGGLCALSACAPRREPPVEPVPQAPPVRAGETGAVDGDMHPTGEGSSVCGEGDAGAEPERGDVDDQGVVQRERIDHPAASAERIDAEGIDAEGIDAEGAFMSTALRDDLLALRSARVLFLHHSVGQNILDAVRRLDVAVDGGGLRILDVDSARSARGGFLAHGPVGMNQRPETKFDEWAAMLETWPPDSVDVVTMKLCFVDFRPDTDVDSLFASYVATVDSLRAKRGDLAIVHMTVPLVARPDDAKARLRRLLGWSVWEDDANLRRNEYNDKIRARFPPDFVFDLAAVEARGPRGAENVVVVRGRSVASLDPHYTDDGGHLNATGARVVASAWAHFVAERARRR
jgi:hypothetical protein